MRACGRTRPVVRPVVLRSHVYVQTHVRRRDGTISGPITHSDSFPVIRARLPADPGACSPVQHVIGPRTCPRRACGALRTRRPGRRGPAQRRPRRRAVRPGPRCLRRRLTGYATATPDTLQRSLPSIGGIILNHRSEAVVRLNRRTYSPVPRQARILETITVPWREGRILRYQGSPVIGRHAPAAGIRRLPGPGRASPVPAATLDTFRAPTPGSPARLRSRLYAASMAFSPIEKGSALPLPRPSKAGLITTPQASRHATDRITAPLHVAFDAGLQPGPSPDRAASLLPGSPAITRTGLSPAGGDELTDTKKHHRARSRCHLPSCWAH